MAIFFEGSKSKYEYYFIHYRMLKYLKVGHKLSRLMRPMVHRLKEYDLSHIILFQTMVNIVEVQNNCQGSRFNSDC